MLATQVPVAASAAALPRRWLHPARLISLLVFALASLIGVFAFVAPFFLPVIAQNTTGMGGQAQSPLFLVALLVLSLGVLMLEAQGRAMNAKLIALLGVLVAINSALRFAETAFPGPGGFTPVFMLIILTGYAFGARAGFLMGALSLLVSAFVTGGVGPWLPYQMFTAGWMGMMAGILDFGFWIFDSNQSAISRDPRSPRSLGPIRASESGSRDDPRNVPDPSSPLRGSEVGDRGKERDRGGDRQSKMRFGMLLIFAAGWGFFYGAIMNLWSWPFLAGDPAQSWQAGLSAADGIKRYVAFYVATSLWWDAFAAIGNVALLALFGLPTLKALLRFKQRFLFEVE